MGISYDPTKSHAFFPKCYTQKLITVMFRTANLNTTNSSSTVDRKKKLCHNHTMDYYV